MTQREPGAADLRCTATCTAAGWFEPYVRTFGGTIAGGTSEIQPNIIAQRLLGLPRN